MTAATLTAAAERHQAALESTAPGQIRVDGVLYNGGGFSLGPIERAPKADGSGWVTMQRLTIRVRKDLMQEPPSSRETFEGAGFTWQVDEVGGQSAEQAAWIIRAVRFPKS